MANETKIFGISLKELLLPVAVAILIGIGTITTALAKMYVDNHVQHLDAKFEKYLKVIQGPFLTIREWKLAAAESDERQLKGEINSLQWDVDNGQATEKDKWLLEQKKQELDELQGTILKLMTGRSTA